MNFTTSELSMIGNSAGALTGRRPSSVTVRQMNMALDRVMAEGVVTRAREHERVLVASEGMESITALSAFEGHCIEIAPLAEPRLKVVGDAFAMAVGQAVVRFGR